MPRLDIPGDVRRVFDVIKDGGVAIWPNDIGYGMIGGTTQALKKIFDTKKRGSHKRNALIGDAITQREVHRLDQRSQDIIETITIDYNLPLGVIAPCNTDHPLLRKVDPELLEASTANGTIAMLLNAGPVYAELTRLSREEVQPLFGSSANLSGTGQRFRADDLQPEIRNAADIVLDYGLRKYHHYGRSVTIMRFPEVEVVRIGTCYELIVDAVRREYSIELPADPGRDVLPSGHLKEFELAENADS